VLTRTDGLMLVLFSTTWRLEGFQRDNPDVKLGSLGRRTDRRGAGLVDSFDFHAARIANEFLNVPTCLSVAIALAMTGLVAKLVVCWWCLWLERFVPPPVGALAGGPGAGCHRGRRTVRRTR
jgi:hypothetical protein